MLDWRSQSSPKLINSLLENGYLPVVSSIGVTDEGQLMNVNADQSGNGAGGNAGRGSDFCSPTSAAFSTAKGNALPK